MGISNVIALLSGVALFLFGMTLMGDGLKKVAGNKLELVLYKLSGNPIKGVLLGTGVTAIIQSSSATSVMVVGFVNSGMMKVKQAIGIIMGAILGTAPQSHREEVTGMQLELSKKEFRRLLDMVYIGNWILNSTRGEDRFRDYDQVESLLFEKARQEGMPILAETYRGETVPSRAFVEGGIHEAIMEYENNVFFDILAEDLARRDMNDAPIDETNCEELAQRIETYINEFEENGTDNILVDLDTTT